jgi:multiple sugar transport system permease protein
LCTFGTAAEPDETIELTVWGQSLGGQDKGLEDAVREFERQNPNVKVRMLSMGAGSMNPQKLMTSIVGNVPPDVIYQDRFTVSDWASRNTFQPLGELIERDFGSIENLREQYYDGPWEEVVWDDQIYGIPYRADTRVLYYNKDVFEEHADELRAAGLDPDRAPRTWSEVLAYSEVLTEFNEDGTLKQAGFIPNFGNSWLYLYAFQMGASFMSEDGREATLNTPETVRALDFMVDGYRLLGGWDNATKFQATFRGGENDPFVLGWVAMKIDGDWNLNWLSTSAPRLNFGTAPPPIPDDRYHQRGQFEDVPDDDRFITWGGGYCYSIPRGAENAELGWEFIKYMTSLEGRKENMLGQREFERQRGRPFIPAVSAHKEANVFAKTLLREDQYGEAFRLHANMMDAMRMRPPTFVGQLLWNEHIRATEAAAQELMSSEAALQRSEDVVQRTLNDYFTRDRFPEIDLRVPAIIGGLGALLGGVLMFAGYKRKRLGPLANHESKWGYLFIAPWMLGFLVFTIGPMIASLFFAFTQYNVMTEARWVGLKNFQDLFTQDQEIVNKAFLNVAYLGGVGVPLGLVTGLAVALLLNSAVRGMRFYRTIFYMPAIVPIVASTVLWIWLLNPDPSRGLINMFWSNTFAEWFGTTAPGWLSSADWAKPGVILMGLWGAGAGMILWLAGLKGIPNQLYEAASIDGASETQQFWTITLPQLSPLIFFNTVMGFIQVLQTFDNVYVITGGTSTGPNDSLLVPVYHLFINGFNYFKMGYASALAWIIFAVVMVITGIQFVLAKYWVHYEVDDR